MLEISKREAFSDAWKALKSVFGWASAWTRWGAHVSWGGGDLLPFPSLNATFLMIKLKPPLHAWPDSWPLQVEILIMPLAQMNYNIHICSVVSQPSCFLSVLQVMGTSTAATIQLRQLMQSTAAKASLMIVLLQLIHHSSHRRCQHKFCLVPTVSNCHNCSDPLLDTFRLICRLD